MAEKETKIIYHVDDEETPYLVKIPKPPDQVTLGDFKSVINRPNFKFFFKSMDDDFGVVKEEIIDDDAPLPCFNGRVVSWVVPPEDGSCDGQSQHSGDGIFVPVQSSNTNISRSSTMRSKERVQDSDAESIVSRRSSRSRSSRKYESDADRRSRRSHREHRNYDQYDSASMMSSDLETTSFVDSEEESQMSSATESSRYVGGNKRRRRRRQRMPRVERCSSFSTITESTMSLNIITVTLNMDKINFLGISIVGQASKKGDGGIYVGSVMKGGAVDADGRVEPGDMILAVGDVNFENMSNDDAVRVLRECVHKPGPIQLTVAKCWDPNPKGYFTVPKDDVTRPIDPAAWVQHSEAMRAGGGLMGRGSPSMSTMTSTSDSFSSSIPEADRYLEHDLGLTLTIDTDMLTIVKVMNQENSGLTVRDRMWLKITIPNAFIGSDLVDWLFANVEGFQDRREARKYASKLLKANLIRHTVNKVTFSEQCYYVFGDLSDRRRGMHMQDIEGSEEDTLAPLASTSAQAQMGGYIQQPYGMAMIPGGMMVTGAPPAYQQVVQPGMYAQYPYVAGSIAPSHLSGGSGGSGSQKSQKIHDDQATVRSSGSSDRSHSSKGSRSRKPMLDDRSSLSSFHSDTISLRSEIIAPDNRSISSHHSIPPMMVMPPGVAYSAAPVGLTPEQQQHIQVQMHQQQQMHHQIQQQLQQLQLQSPAQTPQPPPAGSPQPPQDGTRTPAEQHRELGRLDTLPASLSASRQSFRMAMGNSSNEFFVDVM
ncbi:segment polarity protein dishevelled homolog DVL-3-like [Clytia hemisphaerica]|uniref:Dishevelled n=1 Tax=Clytia hemisphaerica TaxID=252671 RepID=A0A7M5WX06_9CNID